VVASNFQGAPSSVRRALALRGAAFMAAVAAAFGSGPTPLTILPSGASAIAAHAWYALAIISHVLLVPATH